MALRCGKCQYRAKRTDGYRCNYCLITGRTRRAVPPERCRNFQAGDRIEPKSAEEEALREAARKKEKKPRAPGAGAKPRFDWEEARRLYDRGANDGQIGRALGCRPQAVRSWRKRRGLPANTTPGGNRTAPAADGGSEET